MFCHSVYRLHIYDTLVSISTNTPRQQNVVVKYYHTIVYSTGKNCIVAINKYKVKFHYIIYFKNAIVFIVSSTDGSSSCSFLYLLIFLIDNNQILHCFAINSHCIFAINKDKGKWKISLMNKKAIFVYHVEYRWFNRFLHHIAI